MPTRVLLALALLGLGVAAPAASLLAAHPARTHLAVSHSATLSDSLEQILTTKERQSWVAWQKRDGTFFQSFLSDDHVEVGTSGIASKADVVAFVGSPACVVKSYSVDHFRVTRFDDNAALLTYRAEQDTMCGKTRAPSPAWVSSLYLLRNGKWVNALYQQTKES